MYVNPGRHAQGHTNDKPIFADLADIVKSAALATGAKNHLVTFDYLVTLGYLLTSIRLYVVY